MSAKQSNLSSRKYGYDFVVATTQASINTGLKEYLNAVQEPETILCFLADAQGNPTVQITLPDLLAKTGGVSPFDLPDGTPYTDPRITTLTQVGFMVGLCIRLGLPSDILPSDLPPVVTLGASAGSVRFNSLCAELKIVQNTPGSGGSWKVWAQPTDQSWHFTSTVNLVNADLDKELSTPYFANHPAEKAALLAQLENLGSGAFSLQQLLFDLDNAALESMPTIEGLDPASSAGVVLTRSFIGVYFAQVQQNGGPVLSVHAVANTPDGSSLQLTSLEREVGQVLDSNGNVLPNPTPAQAQATTLTLLCAANNHPLPAAAPFPWNWVEPTNVDSISGVISINRNTLATYYKNTLLPLVAKSCLKAWTAVQVDRQNLLPDIHYTLTPGDTPQSVVITDTSPGDPTVLTIAYNNFASSQDSFDFTQVEFNLHPSYSCQVLFSDSTITIVQNLTIGMYVRSQGTAISGNLINRTITDTYALSVDSHGKIATTYTTATQDSPDHTDYSYFMNNNQDFKNSVDGIQEYVDHVVTTEISAIPVQAIQSFVFPGAKVFAYTDIRFSDYQDLVSDITYVAPTAAPAPAAF